MSDQQHRTGRLLSPSSLARRSMSTSPEKAVSVKSGSSKMPNQTGRVLVAAEAVSDTTHLAKSGFPHG
jgi:hypothetical protein